MAPSTLLALAMLGVGVYSLVFGLRTRLSHYRFLAPLGVLQIAIAARHLLAGIVPGVVLVSLTCLALVVCVYWDRRLNKRHQSREANSR